MCGGDFLNKNLEEAMDFLSYVSETSKAWDEPNPLGSKKNMAYIQFKGRHVLTPRRHGNEDEAIHLG